MAHPDALVLVAHGSRSDEGRTEMQRLAADLESRFATADVRLGFLELCEPAANEVLEQVLSEGAKDVVVCPVMLFPAGHSKSDVPAVVVEARLNHPLARIVYARPLGADHALLSEALRRLEAVGATGLPLALFSRGTSDPDANAEAYKVGRLLAEMTGAPVVAAGFSGVTWPGVPETLDQLRRLGAERIAAFAWFIATGILLDRMKEDFASFTQSTGIEVIDGGYLGVGATLCDLVASRAHEALGGKAVPNCDACAYRKPFPGLEDRVGLEIGSGHSHLASAHRHSHGTHRPRTR